MFARPIVSRLCMLVFAAAAGCESQRPDSVPATPPPSTPSAVAQVIDSLETSNDSTQRRLDSARVQLDTALQAMVDISTLLDRLAGQRIEISARPASNGERPARESIIALRQRSVAQLEVLRKRLGALNTTLSTVNDTSQKLMAEVSRLTTVVNSLTRARASQEARLAELTATITRVAAERDSAVMKSQVLALEADTLKKTLDTTIEQVRARDDSVFVLIGDETKLRSLRVAEFTGGMLGVGKVLKLRSDFPKGVFNVGSKQAAVSLVMPRKDREYRVLSGQRESCYSWAEEDSLPVLRVHDADCFWETSRYLVIEEHK